MNALSVSSIARLPRPALAPSRAQREPTLLLDCSLSLINQTGAHFIAEELTAALARFGVQRRWRLLDRPLPRGLWRKLLGRLMLRELGLGQRWPFPLWPEPAAGNLERVFLDPLYVLRSKLERSDIVLCHDIGPISHPELYDAATVRLYRRAYARLQRAQPGMVFVSEASRRAFEAAFGSNFRLRVVIPLYVRGGSTLGPVQALPGIAGKFLLSVGALERRKNQLTALQAFRASGLAKSGYQYVLCGARGAGADEILALASATHGVQVLGYVSDAQLRWLYQNARAFVLPSLLEGFGMPALEAARYGLIPIVSRDSALNEAVGGLGVAVAPRAPDELAQAMLRVIHLPEDERRSWQGALVAHAALLTRERFVQAWQELLRAELGARALEVPS